MSAHGSPMASYTSTDSSFSDLDDPLIRRSRQKLRQNRGPLERALADVITIKFLQLLQTLQVISSSEMTRIRGKSAGQSRSASLIDTVLRKPGTCLKIFIDSLKDRCDHAYGLLNTEEEELSTLQESSSFLTSDLIGLHARRMAEILLIHIKDLQCNIPKFYIHITSVTDAGLQLNLLPFENGFSLAHELVLYDRPDLIKCVWYTGQWAVLSELRVDSDDRKYGRKTPLELCVTLNRHKCQEAILKYNQVEINLEDIAKCARKGDLRLFRSNLKNMPPRTWVLNDGLTVLDYACQSGKEAIVKEAIKHEQQNAYPRSDVNKAASICVELGHFELLKYLKDYMGARFDPTLRLLDNKPLIDRAAFNGDLAMYKELIRLGAEHSKSAISLAASQNCLSFVKSVLELEPNLISSIEFADRRKKVPAHFSAEKGFTEMVQFFMDQDIDLLKTDIRGYNLLHYAATHGSVQLVRQILNKALQKNVAHRLLKAKDKYLGSERIFLVRGHDNARSAWHYVESERYVLYIFREKTKGGAVDVAMYGTVVTSGWGVNPPVEVVKTVEDRYDMTKMNVNSPPDLQPLHVAIIKNHTEASLYLITMMDDVKEPDCFGLSPLHLAAMRGNKQVIQALLVKGASLTARDDHGRTPQDVARRNEHSQDILELLQPPSSPDLALTGLRDRLHELLNTLSDEKVKEQRDRRGQRQADNYIRDNLREVQAEINDYLYEIGAGPVAEASN